MIRIRKANERGHARYDWLDTWHTFSFDTYHDPAHMGFRSLRVMNEDRVQAGEGFGMHAHRDMEIVTYVLEGVLEHKDSMGNGSLIQAGEFQRISAGAGIQHSEFNPSASEPVHFYQIWLFPSQKGLTPGYEQRRFSAQEKQGKLLLVASPEADGSLVIHQDARIFLSSLSGGEGLFHALQPGRHAWAQMLRGAIEVNGQRLSAGDGAAISHEPAVSMAAVEPAEIMLFDLA
jgi:quercetin 2,3-dioxygenase